MHSEMIANRFWCGA